MLLWELMDDGQELQEFSVESEVERLQFLRELVVRLVLMELEQASVGLAVIDSVCL
jgi:hypothetical protein